MSIENGRTSSGSEIQTTEMFLDMNMDFLSGSMTHNLIAAL